MSRLPDVRFERETTVGPAFTAAQKVPPARSPDAPLSIAMVEATDNPALAAAMMDDSLDTRWETVKPQTPGIEVKVTLERPSTVGRIEIDLGVLERTYPRMLRIAVQNGDATPTPVFEGETGGHALLGALRDRRRTTLGIDLHDLEVEDRAPHVP